MSRGPVLVIGLGKTGTAVCEALSGHREIIVYEEQRTSKTEAAAAALSSGMVKFVWGQASPDLLDGIALVVPSPGVPPRNQLLAEAARRSIPVRSEVELGFAMTSAPITAVTGTNGKTTVTSLIAEIIRRGGVEAVASGNIGFPFISAAAASHPAQELVCEVSSFQLQFTEKFRPAVAVVTNVASDHLDWHETYPAYLAAKARISANQTEDDLLVVGAGDEGGLEIARSSKARIGLFGLTAPEQVRRAGEAALGRPVETAAGIVSDEVMIDQMQLTRFSDIRLSGAHNLENVMAAALAGRGRGVEFEDIAAAAGQFQGLPHRSEFVAEIRGVRYIDDSKATNPHAAVAACRGLGRVILIAGGRSKGLDLTALNEARPVLKAVVVMGEAAHQVARVFDGIRCYRAQWVEDAVDIAAGLALGGDTVLLSPGCSSLDQYGSYAERGDRFATRVRQLGD